MRRATVLALLVAVAAGAQEREPIDSLTFVCQWDQQAFYLAAAMSDLNVVGRAVDLNQNTRGDDDLELFLNLGNTKPAKVDGTCYVLAMSAAGGAAFLRGTGRDEQLWAPASPLTPEGQSIRQNVQILGTLNDSTDADVGWSLELRLPWKLLGLETAPVNALWGFNLVRHLRGEQDTRFSVVPQGRAIASETKPDLWGWLRLREGARAGIEAGERHVIVAPQRVDAPEPKIDGRIEPGEWPLTFQREFGLAPEQILPVEEVPYPAPPQPTLPLPPECDLPARPAVSRPARGAFVGDRLVLATYSTDVCDDARALGRPQLGARAADGSLALARQPVGGPGPWLSSLRSGWHRQQLEAAAAAGIDVLLVEYWGDRASRAAWSDAAMASLAVALFELESENRPYPAIGLRLPLEALVREVGGLPALTQQVTQAALYQMIRDFFLALPPWSRALLPDGERGGCLVALESPPREMRADESFLAYCEARFREDFGVDLLWLGPQLWSRRRVPLDAAVSTDPERAWLAAGASRLTSLCLGPGRDSALRPDRPAARGPRGASELRQQFRTSRGYLFSWLLLSSWNDFRRGDNVAASREDGPGEERALAALCTEFSSAELTWVAKVIRAEVPARVPSGAATDCPLRVANGGLRDWALSDDVRVGARWYAAQPQPLMVPEAAPRPGSAPPRELPLIDKTGEPYELPVSSLGGRSDPVFGEARRGAATVLPLLALDDLGRALPPGRYRVRLDGVAGRADRRVPQVAEGRRVAVDESGKPIWRTESGPNWFSDQGDPTSGLMVEVVAPEALPEQAGSVISAPLPGRLEVGRLYPVAVTVRNEGRAPWPAGTRLGVRYEVVRAGDFCRAEPAPRALTGWLPVVDVAAAAGMAQVPPGELVTFPARVPTADRGTPLPTELGPLERCRVSFTILDPDGRPLPAERPHEQTAYLLARDWGAGFAKLEVPPLMAAGTLAGAKVSVLNTGFATWPANQVALAWSWYRPDGLELHYDAGRAPLPQPTESGRQQTVELELTPPDAAGAYVLWFDLLFPDGTRASQQPDTFSRQTARADVAVAGGRFAALDLSSLFNVAGQSTAAAPGEGDFDGRRHSLPAEEMPPFDGDLADGLYPAGFGGPPTDQPELALVPFWYPDPAQLPRNVIRPEGQLIDARPGLYRRIHVLAAAIDGPAVLRLAGRTATGRIDLPPVTVPTWDMPPGQGSRWGFATRTRHGPSGIEPRRCWLHHLVVEVPPGAALSGLELPREPKLRLLAVTLERGDGG